MKAKKSITWKSMLFWCLVLGVMVLAACKTTTCGCPMK